MQLSELSAFNFFFALRKFALAVALILFISFNSQSPAYAEELTIPCGNGATYKVVMPAGVALDGSKCSGPLVVDSKVKIIGKNAFFMSPITSVKLSDSVIAIEANAFSYTKLDSIDFGNSVTSLGFEAFRGTRVSQMNLPQSLINIGESALSDTYFENITIPNSVEVIGKTAFVREDSRATLRSITIPESVRSIGYAAFAHIGLERLTLSKSVEDISASAFEGNKLIEVVIPVGVKYIRAFAFRHNPIQKLTLSSTVELIDSEAFAYTKLEDLVIPTSATELGAQAFANIPTLKTVDFPDNAQSINGILDGDYSISKVLYCGKLTEFYIAPTCEGARKVAYQALSDAATATANQEAANKAAAQAVFEQEQKANIEKAVKDAAVSPNPILIKVVGENPTCPTGFNFYSKPTNVKSVYGTLIVCQSIVRSPADRAATIAADKAAADKAAADKAAADKAAADKAAADKAAADKASVPAVQVKAPTLKSITITCVKGKITKKVSGISPKCSSGYKKK